MPYRGDVFTRGQYYHLYNRGAGRNLLFFNAANYEHCLRLVKRYQQRYGATVVAYCLMPNHYHFLLRQETDEPLSKFVGVLFNAYVQAVNRQEGRSGTLFEGRFRHAWIDREQYLTHLCRYIHLNPVKARLVTRPEQWPYSNYLEWIGQGAGTLQDDALVRDRFPVLGSYQRFVADYRDEEPVCPQIEKYIWD